MTKNTEAFVYLWFDGINRKFYMGVHKGDPDTSNYTHSCKAMPTFSMSTIPKGFHRRILARGSHRDMCELEAKLLMNRQVVINEKYYNQVILSPSVQDKSTHKNSNKIGGRKPKLSLAEVEDLKYKRNQGYLIKDLMKEFDLSKASVYRLLDGESNTTINKFNSPHYRGIFAKEVKMDNSDIFEYLTMESIEVPNDVKDRFMCEKHSIILNPSTETGWVTGECKECGKFMGEVPLSKFNN
jgi:hypothetical protein